MALRCYYDPGYFFPLPTEHPFPMDKFWRSAALIRSEAGAAVDVVAAQPASMEQLLRVHASEYLERIHHAGLDRPALVRLGLPPGPALLERSRREVGGTVAAARTALDEGWACNLAGGTHHAFADQGLGYCVLNDVAIAIRDLQQDHPGLRALVLDTDAHQGNGTNAIFRGDDSVFTYSIHVGRNYPAVKVPGSLDVELPRFAAGSTYLEALATSLPEAIEQFAPDLVLWIAGADVHEADRFGQLHLTDADIAERDEFVLRLLARNERPAAVLYGGGYNLDRLHTARIHADTVLRVAAHQNGAAGPS